MRLTKIYWLSFTYMMTFMILGINFGEQLFGKPLFFMQYDPEGHYAVLGIILGISIGILVSLLIFPEDVEEQFNPYPYTNEQWKEIVKEQQGNK